MDTQIVYAAWSLDEWVRYNSTSGGMFTEIAKLAIKAGYSVAGARYNDRHLVEHDLINQIEDIGLLRQSKYVQSNMKNIRAKMKDKKVLFVGAPCQAASVDADIKIDFVCRGANHPKAYIKYLEMLEAQYKSKIQKVWFKNKTYGWHKFSTRVDFENGRTYLKDRNHDLYMLGYIKYNLFILPACYNCKFREVHHDTDITLGDFWGVRKSLDANKGTSLVIINTKKGLELFNELNVYKAKATIEEAMKGNWCITKHPIWNPKSDAFMELLNKHSFDECFKREGYMK